MVDSMSRQQTHCAGCDYRDIENARLREWNARLRELMETALPIVERAATEEARSNKAPTGLPPRTRMRDLYKLIHAALKESRDE